MLASDDDEDLTPCSNPYADQHKSQSAEVKYNKSISPNVILPKERSEV
jgi:hypothetical protein